MGGGDEAGRGRREGGDEAVAKWKRWEEGGAGFLIAGGKLKCW
jgi:hypothetical protein